MYLVCVTDTHVLLFMCCALLASDSLQRGALSSLTVHSVDSLPLCVQCLSTVAAYNCA
jgi:hypothetical protein